MENEVITVYGDKRFLPDGDNIYWLATIWVSLSDSQLQYEALSHKCSGYGPNRLADVTTAARTSITCRGLTVMLMLYQPPGSRPERHLSDGWILASLIY